MHCLMEPPGALNGQSDHWTLRDYAARIVTLIVEGWGHQLPYIKEIAMKSLQVSPLILLFLSIFKNECN